MEGPARPQAGRASCIVRAISAADGPVPGTVAAQQQPRTPGLLRAGRRGGIARPAHDSPRGEGELVEPAVGAAPSDRARVVVGLAGRDAPQLAPAPRRDPVELETGTAPRAPRGSSASGKNAAACDGSSYAAPACSACRPFCWRQRRDRGRATRRGGPACAARSGKRPAARGSQIGPRARDSVRLERSSLHLRCSPAPARAPTWPASARTRTPAGSLPSSSRFPLSQPPQGALARRRSLPVCYLEDLLCPAGLCRAARACRVRAVEEMHAKRGRLATYRGHPSHRFGAFALV